MQFRVRVLAAFGKVLRFWGIEWTFIRIDRHLRDTFKQIKNEFKYSKILETAGHDQKQIINQYILQMTHFPVIRSKLSLYCKWQIFPCIPSRAPSRIQNKVFWLILIILKSTFTYIYLNTKSLCAKTNCLW